ncbi:MAG: type II CAAX endopeptidase family protein [Candidatus Omnitrophica bacterium]|nr:type II CAAX endopeptidase family protein [Candidatus Omnitrophota bacterium]
MNIKAKDWCIFSLLAVFFFLLWLRIEYPRFAFISLAFDKQQALDKASSYLEEKGERTGAYLRSIVFDTDEKFNRYMQHVSGIKEEERFIKNYDFDLFSWIVRFFKESRKEGYLVYVSPRSGRVTGFTRIIKDTEYAPDYGKEEAQKTAESFLKENFGMDTGRLDFHEEKTKRYENRTEYLFSWEQKGIYIPWKGGQGGAKLLTEITVCADQVCEFRKHKFDIPESFERYVEKQFILGEYLHNIFYIILFIFLAISISLVLKNRYGVVTSSTKNIFYFIAILLFLINSADFFNNLQNVFMSYPSSARLSSFIGMTFSRWLLNTMFLVIGFIMPALAGEGLCSEVFGREKYISFFAYVKSGLLSRAIVQPVALGYLVWIIALGAQAAAFFAGQKYLGVWRDWNTMAYFSSAYLPIFSALVIAASASFGEEVSFRLFGISLAKKYLGSTALAILLTSLIWGMGHTTYAIFPVWFRIIEVSLIGIIYGAVFMRFGIIPLLVAHYLFDVFWCSAAYLLGKSGNGLFLSSLALIAVPAAVAAAAFIFNLKKEERPLEGTLNKIQLYNLEILSVFVKTKKADGLSAEDIRRELIAHNWDHILIELAVKNAFGEASRECLNP